MRAQEMLAVRKIERVVHRARGMVLRLVERGEVIVIGLDFRTVGDFEAERMKKRLDALERAHDGVYGADLAPAAGQGDVERFFLETRIELARLNRFATRAERLFETILGDVEARAHRGTLFRRQLAERLAKLGDHTGFTEV